MKTQIIVSVVGKDQGGFINTLTVKTKELGGRWLANKVAHLDGQVAGLLKMEIDEQKLPEFKAMMAEFTNVIADYHEAIEEASSPTKSVQLTIEGEDRSGLTSDITRLLYDEDVKVEHFESQRYPVIGLGTGVFEAHLDVRLPATVSLESLRAKLETLGGVRVFLAETV